MLSYTKPKKVWLKSHLEYTEKWVQDRIEEDLSILGLGEDLELRASQKRQPGAGRLDLLLEDSAEKRYVLELQLGRSDPSHIIRTIEYWDIERKRYPQYEHCAVLVAEDITSRFLNVVSLFNGTIPLIAIQMQALEVSEHLTLSFIKVIDELKRGSIAEEEAVATVTRDYWEIKAATICMADEVLKIIHEFDERCSLNYTKNYVGLARDGGVDNFVSFTPRNDVFYIHLKLGETEEFNNKIQRADLKMQYKGRQGLYRIRLQRGDIDKHRDLLKELMKTAFETSKG